MYELHYPHPLRKEDWSIRGHVGVGDWQLITTDGKVIEEGLTQKQAEAKMESHNNG